MMLPSVVYALVVYRCRLCGFFVRRRRATLALVLLVLGLGTFAGFFVGITVPAFDSYHETTCTVVGVMCVCVSGWLGGGERERGSGGRAGGGAAA